MKRTYIVGDTPILHNGERLPPGSSITLSFEELRSLGLPLEELPQPAAAYPALHQPVPQSVLAAELAPDVAEPPAVEAPPPAEQAPASEAPPPVEAPPPAEQASATDQDPAVSATKTRKKGA